MCKGIAELEIRKGGMEQGKQSVGESCSGPPMDSGHTLSADAIRRYSRQLLVPSFGVAGP